MKPHVALVASHLPGCVRGNDVTGIDRLLSKLAPGTELPADVTQLILLLAECADWPKLNARTGHVAGSTPRELHAWFVRLRNHGIPVEEIPAHVRAGEREYMRVTRAAKRRANRASGRARAAA